jgi:hypothetical protein
MESSKLINYSTNMCGSGQGPKVVYRCTIFSSPRWMVILLQHHYIWDQMSIDCPVYIYSNGNRPEPFLLQVSDLQSQQSSNFLCIPFLCIPLQVQSPWRYCGQWLFWPNFQILVTKKGPCDNFKSFFWGKKWPIVTTLWGKKYWSPHI